MNPANIGSIFRNAAALGLDAVLLGSGTCDPLSRRCLRVSMGTVFQIPWTKTPAERRHCQEKDADMLLRRESNVDVLPRRESDFTAPAWMYALRGFGYRTAAMALTDRSIPLTDPVLKDTERLALVLGNEGDGLPEEVIASCDYTVRIPMHHGVDSLNVAAASAVAFWALH